MEGENPTISYSGNYMPPAPEGGKFVVSYRISKQHERRCYQRMKDFFRLGTAEIDEMHEKVDAQLEENTEDAKVMLAWLRELSQNVAALSKKASVKQQ
jgi:hypothetical protein